MVLSFFNVLGLCDSVGFVREAGCILCPIPFHGKFFGLISRMKVSVLSVFDNMDRWFDQFECGEKHE